MKAVIISAEPRQGQIFATLFKRLFQHRPEFLHKEFQLRGIDKRVVLFYMETFDENPDSRIKNEAFWIKKYLDERNIKYIIVGGRMTDIDILNLYKEKYEQENGQGQAEENT